MGTMPPPTYRPKPKATRCSVAGCSKQVQTRRLCKAHGGGARCREPNCTKLAQSRGLCVAHGGGCRCRFVGCTKLAQQKGFCLGHGGGRRCRVHGCHKYVQLRGCCKAHANEMEKLALDQGAIGNSGPSSLLAVSKSDVAIVIHHQGTPVSPLKVAPYLVSQDPAARVFTAPRVFNSEVKATTGKHWPLLYSLDGF